MNLTNTYIYTYKQSITRYTLKTVRLRWTVIVMFVLEIVIRNSATSINLRARITNPHRNHSDWKQANKHNANLTLGFIHKSQVYLKKWEESRLVEFIWSRGTCRVFELQDHLLSQSYWLVIYIGHRKATPGFMTWFTRLPITMSK